MEHMVDIFQILWGSVRNTSILLGAQMILQDKSNAIKTIHSKSISSYQLISTRVFTILVLAYLPVLLVSIYFVTCLSMIHQISMFSLFIFIKF